MSKKEARQRFRSLLKEQQSQCKLSHVILHALRDVKCAMKTGVVSKDAYLAFHVAAEALHVKRKDPTGGFSPDPKDETDGKRPRIVPWFPGFDDDDDDDRMEIDPDFDPATLEDLPDEIIAVIIGQLTLENAIMLMGVNPRFRRIITTSVLPSITTIDIEIGIENTNHVNAVRKWLNDVTIPVRLERVEFSLPSPSNELMPFDVKEPDYGSWRWLSEDVHCEILSLVLQRASQTLRSLILDGAGMGIIQLRALGRCNKLEVFYMSHRTQISDVSVLRDALLRLPLKMLAIPSVLTRFHYRECSDDLRDYNKAFINEDEDNDCVDAGERFVINTGDFWLTQSYKGESDLSNVRFPAVAGIYILPFRGAEEVNGTPWFHRLESRFPNATEITITYGSAAQAYAINNAPIAVPASCTVLHIPSNLTDIALPTVNKLTLQKLSVDSIEDAKPTTYRVALPTIEKIAGVCINCERLVVSSLMPPPQASIDEWILSLGTDSLRFLDSVRTFTQTAFVSPDGVQSLVRNFEWRDETGLPSLFAHHVARAMKNLVNLAISFPMANDTKTPWRADTMNVAEYTETLRRCKNLKKLTITNFPLPLSEMFVNNPGRRLDITLLVMYKYPAYAERSEFRGVFQSGIGDSPETVAALKALDPRSIVNGESVSEILQRLR